MGKSESGENPASAFERAARRLLAGRPSDGNSSNHVAERATQGFERIAKHLTRLLGETGVQMLMERSIAIATSRFPWLGAASSAGQQESRASLLRHAMEKQEPGAITDAFVDVLSIFVGLLKRLIGDGLVEQLLDEVWPAVFVPAAKDTP